MKTDGRLGRNWLKGALGDAMHAVLCGAGHNMTLLVIVREVDSCIDELLELHVQALDDFRRLDDPADLGREHEERDHVLRCPPPRLHYRRVVRGPRAGRECFELSLRRCVAGSRVDGVSAAAMALWSFQLA